MHPIILFEDEGFIDLLPLVYWRSVFELRLGRGIVLDRISRNLERPVGGVWTRDWIARVTAERCGAPANQRLQTPAVLVNGRWLMDGGVELPAEPCAGMIEGNVAFVVCDGALAQELTARDMLEPSRRGAALQRVKKVSAPGRMFQYPWDIVCGLGDLLKAEWHEDDATIEAEVDPRVIESHRERIHIGGQARVHSTVVLDATNGPIFISQDTSVGPYCVIEGPAYLGPGAKVNPHTWLHGANSIGPACKVGGEIDGCVIDGYTNKQHSGFLGHSYVGSWVNLGAGCCNSDLKNTYGKIRVPVNGRDVDTGLRFFGAILGDHAKLGINATIPTGSTIGFAASLNTNRTLPKYVPSFSWVTDARMAAGDPARLLDVASEVMARRGIDMTDDEVELFLELGQIVQKYEARA